MKFTPLTTLNDVIYIEPKLYGDERGYFFESYRQDTFSAAGVTTSFVQVNQSHSCKGVLRGLHFQKKPHAQAKLVRVLAGTIFDVAVDIRPDSPTFCKWDYAELAAERHDMLYIPEGFAHGFYVTSEVATLSYSCSAIYAPESEVTIRWDDPTIDIQWPFEDMPICSEKDNSGIFSDQLKHGSTSSFTNDFSA
ncbi:dTDP-4-dehydrorhamnose 3,5-epimerase [Candidatus Marinamargulisbacteria bacterium SCGC AG-414-C22]|nr:dTDP-4-dehydrorhamnose 3,5-epimerase [Candidatus Marinamargulisbacteria bacterium SCGC AG-414-C22]